MLGVTDDDASINLALQVPTALGALGVNATGLISGLREKMMFIFQKGFPSKSISTIWPAGGPSLVGNFTVSGSYLHLITYTN